jgi:hypothetical protein
VEIVLDSGAFDGFGRESQPNNEENDNKKRNSDAVSLISLQLALKKQTARIRDALLFGAIENHGKHFKRRN